VWAVVQAGASKATSHSTYVSSAENVPRTMVRWSVHVSPNVRGTGSV